METIQLDMTWRAAASILCAVMEDGTPQGKAGAREELARMADAADRARELAQTLADARDDLRPLARNYLTMQAAPLTEAESGYLAGALQAFRRLTGDARAEERAHNAESLARAVGPEKPGDAAEELAEARAAYAVAELAREELEARLVDCATLLRYALSPRQTLDRGQAAAAIRDAEKTLGRAIPQAHARD